MAIGSISWQTVYLCTVVLLLGINSQLGQSASYENTASSCASKLTCRDCIQTKSCSWCLSLDYGDKPRCFLPSHANKSINTCAEEDIWNPDNEQRLIIAEELTRGGMAQSIGGQSIAGGTYEASSSKGSYSSSSSSFEKYSKQRQSSASYSHRESGAHTSYGSDASRIVQIYPQRVNLKLRISTFFDIRMKLCELFIDLIDCFIDEVHQLDIKYSQAEDYPVDLYYLMDLSKSMEDDKEKLSKLGDLLADTMRNITSNFRLGFGSFVDKVLMPYVSTVPKK